MAVGMAVGPEGGTKVAATSGIGVVVGIRVMTCPHAARAKSGTIAAMAVTATLLAIVESQFIWFGACAYNGPARPGMSLRWGSPSTRSWEMPPLTCSTALEIFETGRTVFSVYNYKEIYEERKQFGRAY